MNYFKQLFRKCALSFFAIELLTFSEMQKFFFIAQKISRCFGFLIKNININRIDFVCFLCIENVSQKKKAFCI